MLPLFVWEANPLVKEIKVVDTYILKKRKAGSCTMIILLKEALATSKDLRDVFCLTVQI